MKATGPNLFPNPFTEIFNPPIKTQMSFDLHGLSVSKAKNAVQDIFAQAQEKGVSQLTIITGIGNHVNSNGTRGVLFSTMPKWLNDPSISPLIKDYKKDMGAYEITLKATEEESGFWKEITEQTLTPEEIKNLEEIAIQKNDGLAQNKLGLIYEAGIGVTKNYEIARKWHLKAADQKISSSLYVLGKFYWLGQGVKRNDKKAIAYTTEAMHLGNPWAALNLGNFHFEGIDPFTVNRKLAAECYKLAVELTQAQVILGQQHLFGWGIPQNDQEAFNLFFIAAIRGNMIAQYYLGELYSLGIGTEQDNDKALGWFKKSSLQGDVDAKFKVACALLEGLSVKKDFDKGLKKLHKLAKNNHPYSLYLLGHFFLYGYQSLKPIPLVGIENLLRSARLNCLPALRMLIFHHFLHPLEQPILEELKTLLRAAIKKNSKDFELYYLLGVLLDKENECDHAKEIVECYKIAANNGFASAQLMYALTYLEGTIVPKNISIAIDFLKRAAKQKNKIAQFNLGILYLLGKEVKKDEKLAFKYMLDSAKEGYVDAQTGLGFMYQGGMGTTKNIQESIFWFEQAANQGSITAQENLKFLNLQLDAEKGLSEAQFTLGRNYLHRIKPKENLHEGIKWLESAALQNHPLAAKELGLYYMNLPSPNVKKAEKYFEQASLLGNKEASYILGSLYFEKDSEVAYKWFKIADEQGFFAAKFNLACICNSQKKYKECIVFLTQFIASNPTDESFQEDKEIAQEFLISTYYNLGCELYDNPDEALLWFEKAAQSGHSEAQYNLGLLLSDQAKNDSDETLAIHWLTQAAIQGHVKAQLTVACYHLETVPPNIIEGEKWLIKAAMQDNPDAQYHLGNLYIFQLNDYTKGVEWHTKAAAHHHSKAQFALGYYYYVGQGVKQDFEQAFKLYSASAEQNNLDAKVNLAGMWIEGKGTSRNFAKGLQLLEEAAKANHLDAQKKLDFYKKSQQKIAQIEQNFGHDLSADAWEDNSEDEAPVEAGSICSLQ